MKFSPNRKINKRIVKAISEEMRSLFLALYYDPLIFQNDTKIFNRNNGKGIRRKARQCRGTKTQAKRHA